MIDMVPKAIMLNLVAHAKEDLQRELLENLYRTNALDDLLKESEVYSLSFWLTLQFTVNRRKECQRMVESLSQASEIVSAV
jgi:vacuolar protein sorting-associated protein 1